MEMNNFLNCGGAHDASRGANLAHVHRQEF